MPRVFLPQSPGLPPSRVYDSNRKRDQFRRRHPAKKGRPTKAEREPLVRAIIRRMGRKSPEAIAMMVKRDVGTVRAVIRAARTALAAHALDYLKLHRLATVVAASKGDASPAEWALQRIQAEGERVIDPPRSTPKGRWGHQTTLC